MIATLGDQLAGRLLFPASNSLVNNRFILRSYRQLRRTERWRPEALREHQRQQLARTVRYAYDHVPYYRRLFDRLGAHPEDFRSTEDLRRLPILTRETVVAHHRELVDERLAPSVAVADRSGRPPGKPLPWARFRRHRLVRNTSTGSTGQPTIFYDDGSASALCWAHELRLKSWFGHGPGVREARLKRVSTEMLWRSRTRWLRQLLWHQLLLPGMNLREADYARCVAAIRAFRPRIWWGITTALAGLTDFIERAGYDVADWRPELVITWAAPVYAHEERLFRRVLGCDVSNVYGTREVGHVALRCPAGSLHVNQESYIVEASPDRSVGDGESSPGEVLVTTLYETPMPFIRYAVGDLGVMALAPCACGRTLPVVQQIVGRTGDPWIGPDGRMVAPNFWCRAFMDDAPSRAVERFQVVYLRNGGLRFRIVRGPAYSSDVEAHLRKYLRANLPPTTGIDLEYHDRLDPLPSGKHQMVVREPEPHDSAAHGC